MTSSHGEQPRSSAPPAPSAGVDAICDAFEAAWFAGQQPRIEDFLSGGDPDHPDGLLRELLLAEWDLLRRREQHIELQAYRERFVQNSELVAELWHAWQCAGEETLPPGRSIFFANGRYHLQSRLGEGAQKRVFLARDKELDRDVVIGVLNRGQIESDSLNRLRREAKAMARLEEHPNVVSVYDIGEEDGNPFIVTQYVRGGSVADMLSACKPAPLQIPEAIRIAAQTCRALNHAHAHGILHRDVKPTNVWLMRDGTVKLGDFGLALSLDRTELTDEDMRVGTAAYIAPEQALGAAVGPQSDLYSLGVMLYEMVAGRRPFYGDTALAVISQHVNSRPVAPSWHNPAIDDALDRLILELLAMLMVTRNPSPLLWPEATQAILRSKVPSNSQAMRGNSWPGIDSRPCLDVDWWRDGRLRSGRIGIEEDPRSISELSMPQFLIERNFAEQLEVTKEVASTIKQVNDELSLRWVFSFLSADKKKTYCLYEAPSAEAIREAARRLNIPADRIIELGGQLRPEMFQ